MRRCLLSTLFLIVAFARACNSLADDIHPESQVKTGAGDYVLCAANRVVLRIHVKTGRTYVTEHREWKPVTEPETILEGEYDLLLTYARTVTEVFRIEKKTGATWGLGYSDSDPKREKPRWFRITETPFPPPLDKKSI